MSESSSLPASRIPYLRTVNSRYKTTRLIPGAAVHRHILDRINGINDYFK